MKKTPAKGVIVWKTFSSIQSIDIKLFILSHYKNRQLFSSRKALYKLFYSNILFFLSPENVYRFKVEENPPQKKIGFRVDSEQ